ncbi:hypothetical protein [Paenibacillus contaminans]|uniref:hypothetical protein n=1 Tax=Paenibacillus contaminans TaxID=450362 RepID=UPI0011BF5665|nr:hypothetical protein [Paenibacillus contaminans]
MREGGRHGESSGCKARREESGEWDGGRPMVLRGKQELGMRDGAEGNGGMLYGPHGDAFWQMG